MNAPKYINILKSSGIKFFIDGESVIVDNEDGTYINITDYSEDQFFSFLGF